MKTTAKNFRTDNHGASAVEFAFLLPMLAYLVMNVTDLSLYVYTHMEVDTAAQMGVQAAWKTCDQTMLPATTKCPGLNAAVTAAIGETELGANISLVAGSLTEGYYCVNSANALQWVSTVASKPANCTAAGMPALTPADYITLQVTYTYAPMFSGITIVGLATTGGLLTTPITKTAFMRMG